MPLHLHNIYKGKQLAFIILASDIPLVWFFWHHICPVSKFGTNLVFCPCVCSLHRCDMQPVLSEVVWTLALV